MGALGAKKLLCEVQKAKAKAKAKDQRSKLAGNRMLTLHIASLWFYCQIEVRKVKMLSTWTHILSIFDLFSQVGQVRVRLVSMQAIALGRRQEARAEHTY